MNLWERAKKNRTNPLYIAFYITIFYIFGVAMVSMFQSDNYCENAEHLSKMTWRAIWHGCLSMNELGDFLAGTSALLAFIWLAAAVFIQSHELREQREELILTRHEFKLNRKVLVAQAKEAKRQAKFIGQQTEILKAEKIERDGAHKTREFEGELEVLVSSWLQYPNALTFKFKGGERIYGPGLNTLGVEKISSYKEKIRQINLFSSRSGLTFELKTIIFKKDAELCDPTGFREVYQILCRLSDLYQRLPIETQLVFDSILLHQQKSLFEQFHGSVNGTSPINDEHPALKRLPPLTKQHLK